MVIWLIGLSGSGKTTIAKEIIKLCGKKLNLLHLDGDEFRKLFSNDIGYSLKDRKINAERISKITYFLSENKVHVIVSVLSNYPYWLDWNKRKIKDYKEFYIKADIKILYERNKKNLYKSKKKHVVGKDIRFKEPKNSDYVFFNDFKKNTIGMISNKIIETIPKKFLKS